MRYVTKIISLLDNPCHTTDKPLAMFRAHISNDSNADQLPICSERIFPMILVPTDQPTHFLWLEMTQTQLICDWHFIFAFRKLYVQGSDCPPIEKQANWQ